MMHVRYLYGCNPSGCIDVMISLLRFSIMFFSSAPNAHYGAVVSVGLRHYLFLCLCKSLCCTIAHGCRCPLCVLPVLLDIPPPLDFHGPGWMYIDMYGIFIFS
eukprot:NODE_477_length_7951_cov_0.254075.p5 type:complete len:103 gc:universal NODE_477_length_7951_cov_0.254075:2902-3210(+)